MSTADVLRDVVARQLTELCALGGPMNTDAPGNTRDRYRFDSRDRGPFLRQVRARYFALQDPPREGRSEYSTPTSSSSS